MCACNYQCMCLFLFGIKHWPVQISTTVTMFKVPDVCLSTTLSEHNYTRSSAQSRLCLLACFSRCRCWKSDHLQNFSGHYCFFNICAGRLFTVTSYSAHLGHICSTGRNISCFVSKFVILQLCSSHRKCTGVSFFNCRPCSLCCRWTATIVSHVKVYEISKQH